MLKNQDKPIELSDSGGTEQPHRFPDGARSNRPSIQSARFSALSKICTPYLKSILP
jgi:hypothetical protein